MTSEQRLDRLERIVLLIIKAGLRGRKRMQELDEKIEILVDSQIRTDELFRETREQFRESREQFRETREQFRETKDLFRETARRFGETDELFRRSDERFARLSESQFRTDRKLKALIDRVENG